MKPIRRRSGLAHLAAYHGLQLRGPHFGRDGRLKFVPQAQREVEKEPLLSKDSQGQGQVSACTLF